MCLTDNFCHFENFPPGCSFIIRQHESATLRHQNFKFITKWWTDDAQQCILSYMWFFQSKRYQLHENLDITFLWSSAHAHISCSSIYIIDFPNIHRIPWLLVKFPDLSLTLKKYFPELTLTAGKPISCNIVQIFLSVAVFKCHTTTTINFIAMSIIFLNKCEFSNFARSAILDDDVIT